MTLFLCVCVPPLLQKGGVELIAARRTLHTVVAKAAGYKMRENLAEFLVSHSLVMVWME